MLQRFYRVDDIVGRVDNQADMHIARKVFRYLCQTGFNSLGNLDRVGSRLLLNDNHAAKFAVGIRLLGALLRRVVDMRHVAQIDRRSAVGAHHEVEHLVDVGKLFLHTH